MDRSRLFALVCARLQGLVPDWDFAGWPDRISPASHLIADLGLTSVEFVELFVGIEQDLGRTIGFHDLLMVDGRYISDLRIDHLLDYVGARIVSSVPAAEMLPTASQDLQAPHQCSTVDTVMLARFRSIIPHPGRGPEVQIKNRRAVFLLSAPRSGSTLLQTILAGHPGLFAPPELHLLWFQDLAHRKHAFQQDNNRHLVSGAIRAIMELDQIDSAQGEALLDACARQAMPVPQFYALLQRRLGRKRLLVDKTPANAYSQDVLRRAEDQFREPLYVHLVRHPCGMMRSFIDAKLERTVPFMMRHGREFTRDQLAELAWLVCNENITAFLEGIPPERQVRLHYEDLVTSPQASIGALCGFLGLDYRAEMLDAYEDKQARMVDGLHSIGEMSGDLKFHLHGRIDRDAAERWRRFLSEEAASTLTWRLAESLDYARRH